MAGRENLVEFGIVTILDEEFETVYSRLQRKKKIQNLKEPTCYTGFIRNIPGGSNIKKEGLV